MPFNGVACTTGSTIPSLERTVAIIRGRVPAASTTLAEQVAAAVARLRTLELQKPPGVAEAINWVSVVGLLGLDHLDEAAVEQTLGAVLKYREDIDLAREQGAGLGGDLLSLDLADVAGSLGQLLHAAGIPVTPERSGRFARAVALARPLTVDELYWLGRVTLLTGFDQLATFDAIYGQVFRGLLDVADHPATDRRPHHRRSGPAGLDPPRPARRRQPAAAPAPLPPRLVTKGPTRTASSRCWRRPAPKSGWEPRTSPGSPRRSSKPSGTSSPRLAVAVPLRASHRRLRHHHGPRLDLRATLRRAHRHGGDPVEWILRQAKPRPRRLVLLADVSGSMEPYARAYLHLLHGAVRGARAEAFVFATRLTRLTRALATTDPDLALARATAAAPPGQRHPYRRRPGRLQRRVRAAGDRPGGGGGYRVRWLGLRRPGHPRRADGPPGAFPPHRVGQPPDRQ